MNNLTEKQISNFINKNLYNFDHPEAYIQYGLNFYSEKGTGIFHKEQKDSLLDVLYAASWDYISFAGNMGLPLLYQITNNHIGSENFTKALGLPEGYRPFLAERSHFPTAKEVKLLDKHGIPMFGLESRRPLSEFDIVGTSLGYHALVLNIFKMMRMSHIPVKWKDRQDMQENYPLFMGGGSLYGSPESWAASLDIIFIGETEDEPGRPGLMAVYEDIAQSKHNQSFYTKEGRETLLYHLAKTYDFLYIPRFITPVYNKSFLIEGWDYKYPDIPKRVKKRYVKDLDSAFACVAPPISFFDATMGLGEIEASRGCSAGGCNFSVGMTDRINTSKGLLQLGSFVTNNMKPVKCFDNKDCIKVTEDDVNIDILINGQVKQAVKIMDEGDLELLEIKTSTGHKVHVTPNHKLLVRQSDGREVWKEAQDLSLQDYCVLDLTISNPVKYVNITWDKPEISGNQLSCEIPSHINEDFGYFIGYLIGNGSVLKKDKGIDLLCSDTEVLDKVLITCNNLFGPIASTSVHSCSDICTSVRLYRKVLALFFKDYLKMSTDNKHKIPEYIFRSPLSVKQAFILGLWDADAHCDENHLYLSSMYPRLVDDIGILLLSMGVRHSLWEGSMSEGSLGNNALQYRVLISKSLYSENNFFSEMVHSKRALDYVSWCAYGYGQNNAPTDYVPYHKKPKDCRKTRGKVYWTGPLGNVSIGCLEKYGVNIGDFRNKFYSQVKDIIVIGKQPAGDITVPDGEAFVVNGFVSHNCAIGFRYKPYRERSVGPLLDALKQNILNTGSGRAFPTAFELTGYTEKNLLIKRILQEVCSTFDTQSQRIDNMAQDPNFVNLAGYGGMTQLAVGVEGNSERLRTYVNKGATEEIILKAIGNAFKAGYKKIKLFFIADFPAETKEDADSVVELGRKIMALRQNLNSRATIMFSWTPLTIEAWTPLQWNAPTLEEKKLFDVFPRLRELGIDYTLGKKTAEDYTWVAQLTDMADRLVGEALVDASEEVNAYFAGTPVKGFKDVLEKHLKLKGISAGYKHYFSDKPKDYKFGWDIIDMGVTKEYLWKVKEQSDNFIKQTDTSDIDHRGNNKNGFLNPKCALSCTNCGGCSDTQEIKKTRDMFKKMQDDRKIDLGKIKVKDEVTVLQKINFKIFIAPEYKHVHNSYWKCLIRRAAYRSGVPITKDSIVFSSGEVTYRNWVSGIEYIQFSLLEKYLKSNKDVEKVICLMNENIDHGLKFITGKMVSIHSDNLNKNRDLSFYEMVVDKDIYTIMNSLDEWQTTPYVKASLKTDSPRAGLQREEVNAKDYIQDVWLVKAGTDIKLRFLARGKLSPFDFYCSFFKTRLNEAYKVDIIRLGTFVKQQEGQADFFNLCCPKCEKELPLDLLGKLSDCPQCLE